MSRSFPMFTIASPASASSRASSSPERNHNPTCLERHSQFLSDSDLFLGYRNLWKERWLAAKRKIRTDSTGSRRECICKYRKVCICTGQNCTSAHVAIRQIRPQEVPQVSPRLTEKRAMIRSDVRQLSDRPTVLRIVRHPLRSISCGTNNAHSAA